MRTTFYLLLATFSLMIFTFCDDDNKVDTVDYDLSGYWECRDTSMYQDIPDAESIEGYYPTVAFLHHVLSFSDNSVLYTIHTKDSMLVEDSEVVDKESITYEGTYSMSNGKIFLNISKSWLDNWNGKVMNDTLFVSGDWTNPEGIYAFHRIDYTIFAVPKF